eukprot:m.523859 g.523859  ORF g.523859 m.523859 type:complete len:624 (-) comp21981_c0_seq1:135-2006(-)
MAAISDESDQDTVVSDTVKETNSLAHRISRLQSVTAALKQAKTTVNVYVNCAAAKHEAKCLHALEIRVAALLSEHQRELAFQALREASILATCLQRRRACSSAEIEKLEDALTTETESSALIDRGCSAVESTGGDEAVAQEQDKAFKNAPIDQETGIEERPGSETKETSIKELLSDVQCVLSRIDGMIKNTVNDRLSKSENYGCSGRKCVAAEDFDNKDAPVLNVWYQARSQYGDSADFVHQDAMSTVVSAGTRMDIPVTSSALHKDHGLQNFESERIGSDDVDLGDDISPIDEDGRLALESEDGGIDDMPFVFDEDVLDKPSDGGSREIDTHDSIAQPRHTPDVGAARPRAATAGHSTPVSSPRILSTLSSSGGTHTLLSSLPLAMQSEDREPLEGEMLHARTVRSTSMSISPSKGSPAHPARTTLPRRFTDSGAAQPSTAALFQPSRDGSGMEERSDSSGRLASDGSRASDWDGDDRNTPWRTAGASLADQGGHLGGNINDTQFVSISVSAPRTNKTANIFATHTTYRVAAVRVTGDEVVVERRYNDFLALQTSLRKQYPNLRTILPALPEKKILGKFKSSFVEKRRVGLEAFVTAVKDNQRQYRFIARFLNRFVSDTWQS